MSEVRSERQKHWLVRAKSIRWLWRGFAVVLAGLVASDFVLHPHKVFGVDGTFGFYAWYGLLTCMAMVLFAKALGVALKREDSYYESGTGDE